MDTIELLEAIGSDAGLHSAPRGALLDALARMGASSAVVDAVARGDRAPLAAEFGSGAYCAVESTHAPGHEGEDGDDDEPEEPKEPEDPEDPAGEADHGS
jgi:hypothetical protein